MCSLNNAPHIHEAFHSPWDYTILKPFFGHVILVVVVVPVVDVDVVVFAAVVVVVGSGLSSSPLFYVWKKGVPVRHPL